MDKRSLPFVDIHCHMLPGIDDGSDSWETTLAMAKMSSSDGFSTVIVTPHQLGNFAVNDGDMIRQLTQKTQSFLHENGVDLQLLPGGDVRIEPEMISLIQSGNVLSLGDQRKYVLLELPHELYFSLDQLLERLDQAGMVGILSHPERNMGILQQPAIIDSLVSQGCLMQVTAGSITGAFGGRSQQLSEQMLSRGLVHFCATDAHGLKSRRPKMSRAFDRIADLTDGQTALDLCCRNPANVATGKPVSIENRPVAKKGSFFGSLFSRKKAG